MPVATVKVEYERFDLSTLEDAWIELRPLPYGLKLDRQEKAMRTSMTMEGENRAQRRGKEAKTGEEVISMEFAMRTTRQIEFDYCIGDHNLTDAEGVKLDLGSPLTMNYLDPRVGTEIGNLLDEINGGDLDEEGFTPALSKSSSSEIPEPSLTN